jgi:ABC-type amino acid transport system permease subunit
MTSGERKEAISAFIFLFPFFLWLVFIMGGPILAAFFLSFCKWDILTPIQFVGFENYKEMIFNDPRFWKALYNTAYFTLLSVPIGMILSILVAMLMNQKVKGIGIYRTLFYLPSVVGAGVAVAVLWKWIFNADSGLLNYMISFLTGIPISDCPKWLASEVWSKPALVIMSLWGVGGGMIIYLAGLDRRGQPLAAILGGDPARTFPGHLLPIDHLHRGFLPDIHPGRCHDRRAGRSRRFHIGDGPLYLPEGLQVLPNGLRFGPVVGPVHRDHAGHLDPVQIFQVGLLRGRTEEIT